MRRRALVSLAVLVSSTLVAASAAAQDVPPPPPPPQLGAGGPQLYAPAAGERATDGVRFRAGVSAVGGTMFLNDYSGGLFGAEGRFGVQINNLIGVYATPHLVFGPVNASGGGASVSTVIGVFAGTGDVDFTFIDHVYVGAGGGFGVVNNPTGPVLHFRAGGYPFVGTGENGYRRKGLQIGVDSRFYFLSGGLTVAELTGGIGYEAF